MVIVAVLLVVVGAVQVPVENDARVVPVAPVPLRTVTVTMCVLVSVSVVEKTMLSSQLPATELAPLL